MSIREHLLSGTAIGLLAAFLPFVLPIASSQAEPHQISRSLRFNSADSAYLSRTPGSAGNRKLLSFRVRIKRCALGAAQVIASAGTASIDKFYFDSSDRLCLDVLGTTRLVSTDVFRDVGAWFDVGFDLDVANGTAASRARIVVENAEVGAYSTDGRASIANTDTNWNNTVVQYIGRDNSGSYLSAYISEPSLADGTTTIAFSSLDTDVNAVLPVAPSATWGTNGFYLDLSDNSNTTAVTLGADRSGNGNNWTPTNFSVSAGVGNDSLVDTPTNYGTDTGAGGEVRGNYATLTPLNGATAGTLSNGNLRHAGSSGAHMALATWQMTSGKHYCEGVITTGTSTYPAFGIYRGTAVFSGSYLGGVQWSIGMFTDRAIYRNGSIVTTPSGTNFSSTDIFMMFFDADAGTLYFGRNGTWFGSANPSAGTGAHVTGLTEKDWHFASGAGTGTVEFNFGQRPFAYTPPTGSKVQCTQNRADPAVMNPLDFFDIDTFSGTAATRSKTGMQFQPDFAWFKSRSTTTDHAIYDSVRGAQKRLETNNTDDEVTGDNTGLTSFNADGYTTGALAQINNSGQTFISWLLKKSPTCGFDIVTYTGNGSNRTIAHSLGVAPKMIIVKALSTAGTNQGWAVYHEGVASDPQTDYLLLNSTGAVADDNTYWNDTLPTSSVFSVGTNAAVNTNGDTYVAYLFTDVSGFCKVGNYAGNASADGPLLWCGFRPRFLLVKSTASSNNWVLVDSARRVYNPTHVELYPDSTAADNTGNTRYLDFLSTGFKIRNTEALYNGSSVRIVFLAFAETAFKFARAA